MVIFKKRCRPTASVFLEKEIEVVGSMWGRWARYNPKGYDENVAEIVHFFESGPVPPRVDRIFPLEEFIKAFELFENNQGRGNTVVCLKEE